MDVPENVYTLRWTQSLWIYGKEKCEEENIMEREKLTDDFSLAEQAGKQALCYGELAGDRNLQVASLIGLANIGFHRANIHRENSGLRGVLAQ